MYEDENVLRWNELNPNDYLVHTTSGAWTAIVLAVSKVNHTVTVHLFWQHKTEVVFDKGSSEAYDFTQFRLISTDCEREKRK